VLPPHNEARYIPAVAIRDPATVTQTAPPPTAWAAPGPTNSLTSAIPARPESILQQAQRADLDGQVAEAIRLYEQAAGQTTDGDVRNRCLNRIYFLQQRSGAAGQMVQATPAAYSRSASEPRAATSLGGSSSSAATTADPCATVRLRPPVYDT